MITRSNPGQGGLFDADPPANSPEDLGYRAPQAPQTKVAGPTAPEEADTPEWDPAPSYPRAYGEWTSEARPRPDNHCRSAIQVADAREFVAWLEEQDLPVHANCTVGHILVNLSGLGRPDLKWLCQAIRQADIAPAPSRMRAAVLKHDVALLRAGQDGHEVPARDRIDREVEEGQQRREDDDRRQQASAERRARRRAARKAPAKRAQP